MKKYLDLPVFFEGKRNTIRVIIGDEPNTLAVGNDFRLANTTITSSKEVDFGTAPYQVEKTFTVIDDRISDISKILLTLSGTIPSDGRSVDEIMAESLVLSAKAKTGSFNLHVQSLNGSLNGKMIINYSF